MQHQILIELVIKIEIIISMMMVIAVSDYVIFLLHTINPIISFYYKQIQDQNLIV